MAATQILTLYFDAPMQSYGVESRFDRRTSLPWPSRSVVTGILCAALGIDRTDREFLATMANLSMETFVLKRENNRQMARLIDYHTVGGGYDDSDKLNVPRTVETKSNRTIQSYREYLLDARFGVLLSGNDELIKKFDAALRNPVWGIWFGRKCCIPASPVTQGVFENRNDAIQKLCRLVKCDSPQLRIKEVDSYFDGTDSLMDIPVTFERNCRGMGGEFLPRRIIVERL